ERVRGKAESFELAERDLRSALGERQLRLEALDDDPDLGAGAARIAELEVELQKVDRDGSEEGARLRREAAEAEARRAAARRALAPLAGGEEEARTTLHRATRVHGMARDEARKAYPRRAARAGDVAAVEGTLASAAPAAMLEAGAGRERAVAAVLAERLRASIVGSLREGRQRLSGAEGAARALLASAPAREPSASPKEGARRLIELVDARGEAAPI